jgi:formylglycine-generating enzyme required for sulfatase activity
MVSVKRLLCFLMVIGYSVSLEADIDPLIEVIVAANQANKSLLDSFDCNYQLEIISPPPGKEALQKTGNHTLAKQGRYAFKDDKVYSMDRINDSDFYLHYVRNGSQIHTRTQHSPGLVMIGSASDPDIKPGTPDPWATFDHNISVDLKSLPPKTSIKRVEELREDDRDYIMVSIARIVDLPDGTNMEIYVDMWYSTDNGYMPVKYKVTDDGNRRWGGKIVDGKVEEIKKYSVGGNMVYLPVRYGETVTKGEMTLKKMNYNINPESVKINPDLPDDLFIIKILPDDQVVNKDLGGLELQGPGGRQFLYEVANSEDAYQQAIENKEKIDSQLELCNGVKVEITFIPPGEFRMGSPYDEIGLPESWLKRYHKEGEPTRPTTDFSLVKESIEKEIFMSRYEITCEQYRCFKKDYKQLPHDGRKMDEDRHPVLVDKKEAEEFCQWLSHISGKVVRLPYEKEWEYACRSGSISRFFWGEDEESAGLYSNLADLSFEKVWPQTVYPLKTDDGQPFLCYVGKYKPNKFGLYDMIGNASEWCQDEISGNDQNLYVVRGGAWNSDIATARCASRVLIDSREERCQIGFRIVIEE